MRSPVPDEVFAGRLVEASRVPVCIPKDPALLRPRAVVWGEGLRCRNMEPKKTESEQEIALLNDFEPLEPYGIIRLVPLEDFAKLHLVLGRNDVLGDQVEVEPDAVIGEVFQGLGA